MERAGIVPGATNAVVARREERALIIDPGLDRTAADRVWKACAAQGLHPAVLLFTHAHADHSGAIHYLQRRSVLPAFGPPFEAEVAAAPLLEPVYLWGGAEPFAELTGSFTCAKPAVISGRLDGELFAPGEWDLGVIPLPGHSPGQAGFDLGSGVLAVGDALIPAPFREKYPLLFLTDLDKARRSLREIAARRPRLVVPGHGRPLGGEELRRELAANEAQIDRIEETVLAAARTPGTSQDILAAAAGALGLALAAPVNYLLALTTVQAALAGLARRGLVGYAVEDNRLLWRTA